MFNKNRHDLHCGPAPSGVLRVDRATPYGNPFHIGKDGDRAEVIEKFRAFHWDRLKKAIEEKDSVTLGMFQDQRLRTGDVACWCPKHLPCHSDVLVRAARWLRETHPIV